VCDAFAATVTSISASRVPNKGCNVVAATNVPDTLVMARRGDFRRLGARRKAAIYIHGSDSLIREGLFSIQAQIL